MRRNLPSERGDALGPAAEPACPLPPQDDGGRFLYLTDRNFLFHLPAKVDGAASDYFTITTAGKPSIPAPSTAVTAYS
jgi:hypothetical protein